MNRKQRRARSSAKPASFPSASVNLPEHINDALRHHRLRDLASAKKIYRRILAITPYYPDALHLLGTALREAGRQIAGLAAYKRAIALDPSYAGAHSNSAAALKTDDQDRARAASATI